jgi:hypothetical protein
MEQTGDDKPGKERFQMLPTITPVTRALASRNGVMASGAYVWRIAANSPVTALWEPWPFSAGNRRRGSLSVDVSQANRARERRALTANIAKQALPAQPASVVQFRSGANGNSRNYGEINPMVRNHVSTRSGHLVIGSCVRRNPKACLPCAYRCISAGTPAFIRAI